MAALILGMIVFGGLVGRYGTAEVDEVGPPEDETQVHDSKKKNGPFRAGILEWTSPRPGYAR
jgi:hypothetical protein